MKVIIEINEDIFNKALNGRYKCKECFDAIANGTPIPDSATNGEVIEIMFPNGFSAKKSWWDAPYQKSDKE